MSTAITIDSTKIRIPANEVVNLAPEITDVHILISKETGEQLDEFKNTAKAHKLNGITTRVAIEKQKTKDQTVKTFVTIGFNSKTLKGKYLEGITRDNIHEVYEYIMSTGLMYCTFESFMKGELTDTDIKRDVILIDPSLREVIREIKQKAIPKKEGTGMNVFGMNSTKEETNVGLQFSKRETTQLTNPFWKIYHKSKELKHNSETFALAYDINPPEALARIETTIKNKKHWRSHGVSDTSLEAVLELSQEKLNEIMHKHLRRHLEPREAKKMIQHDINTINPADQFAIAAMEATMRMNLGSEGAINELTKYITTRSSKSKYRTKLRELHDQHLKQTDGAKKSEKMNEALNAIGWNF